MTATLAIIGYGSLFQNSNNDSPVTWTTLAEVRTIPVPPITRDVIDAGHECAPNEWREVLTGIAMGGDITVECNYYKTVYQSLLTELGTNAIKTRRIVFPGGSNLVFNAFLISIASTLTVGDLVVAQAIYRPSGQPVFTVV